MEIQNFNADTHRSNTDTRGLPTETYPRKSVCNPRISALKNYFNLFNKKFVMGFTMLEVIIATLIIAIVAAGTASAFWGSQHFLSNAKHRVQAYNFAVEALDRLRSNYKYGDPEMTGSHNASDISCSISGEMAALAPLPTDFAYVVTEPEPNGYKQVSVTVHWNEPR